MIKKLHYLNTLVLLSALPLFAQSLLGFQYPLGMPIQGGCGTALSLAGTGTGIGNDFFGLTHNPANLGITGRTTFSSTVSGDVLTLKSGKSQSRHLDMNLRLISLSVPVSTFGAFGVSVEPYSTTNFRYRYTKPLNNDASLADSAQLGIIDKGGALSWQVGWGYSIKKKVRVGLAYRYLNFNNSLTKIRQTYGSLNDRSSDSTISKFTTSGFRAGVQIPIRKLTIGITGDYFLINRMRTTRVLRGTRDTTDKSIRSSYDFKPPPTVTAGISYQFDPRWLAAIDGGATLWDQFYSPMDYPVTLSNAIFASGGVEFIPAPNLLKPKMYEITHYRAGIRYAQLPSADAVEAGGTLALGLPLQASGGMFDIIFSFARRWDTRFSNIREDIISVKLGINGARKWYQSSDESY